MKANPFGPIGQVAYLHSDLVVLIDFNILKDDLSWDDFEGLGIYIVRLGRLLLMDGCDALFCLHV